MIDKVAIDKVALALLDFETRSARQQFPQCSAVDADGWSVLLSEKGKEYWRQMARAAIEAMPSNTPVYFTKS